MSVLLKGTHMMTKPETWTDDLLDNLAAISATPELLFGAPRPQVEPSAGPTDKQLADALAALPTLPTLDDDTWPARLA